MNKNIMNFIKKNDLISFVGGGGKTTIMFNIAFAASKRGLKVLVTTTTKIFLPEKHCYEKIVLRETIFNDESGKCAGITVFGQNLTSGKIIGTSENDLRKYIENEDFDLILIEADGSRRKSLKAYKEHEPVIPSFSNKVLAVCSLDSIGTTIDERYIYNSKRISHIFGKKYASVITKEDIVKFISSDEGLFENVWKRDKCFVLTKCVNKERRDQFEFIKRKLEEKNLNIEIYENY